MNKSGTPFVEALKEMGRYIILGIIAWLLAGGIEILLGFFQTSLSFETRSIIITLFTIVLRGVDKYMHRVAVEEVAKDRNEGLLGVRGITYI
jgi:hypothetical protein